MAYTVYNCDALTGGATRALDDISVSSLNDKDRAFVMVDGLLIPFLFDASSTEAEDVTDHPYKVRPDDYSTAGVWIEQTIEGIPFVGENLIINPQFEINQEVITAGTHSADEYFRDQWKAGASGCTVSLSGDVLTISAGSVIQPIEDVNIPNGTYTLSWEGTAQAKIDGGSAQSSPYTFTVSSGTHVEVEFTTGTLEKPVLVEGSVAGKFRERYASIEALLCQRYFSKSYISTVAPGTVTLYGANLEYQGSVARGVIRSYTKFPIAMRTTPTVTIYSPNTGNSGYLFKEGVGDGAVSSINSLCNLGFATLSIASTTAVCWWQHTADARL